MGLILTGKLTASAHKTPATCLQLAAYAYLELLNGLSRTCPLLKAGLNT